MAPGRVAMAVVAVVVLGAWLGAALLLRGRPPATEAEAAQFGTWVRGAELLGQTGLAVRARHGHRIVHQSWKTERVPSGLMARCFASWGRTHPDALHVLWTDEDNERLVREHYPEWAALYAALPMSIMRADLVRLLYLHRFGGVYVDMDFEARSDLFAALPRDGAGALAEVYLAESPVPLLGVTENSLMAATTLEHPFWRECVATIAAIMDLVQRPGACARFNWSGCLALLPLFQSPLFGKLMYLTHLLDMTGPNVLAKTLVAHLAQPWRVRLLPRDRFHLDASVTVHHQMNSWMVVFKMWELFLFGAFVLAALVGLGAVLMWCALRRHPHEPDRKRDL